MDDAHTVYVVGAGAVGMALAACLVEQGRRTIAIRTLRGNSPEETIQVTVHHGADRLAVSVDTVGLAMAPRLDGVVAVTAKAYANPVIATALHRKGVRGPVVILQNGVGVEAAFIEAGIPEIYRCVLYVSSQSADGAWRFRAIKSSPIGVFRGNAADRDGAIQALNTGRLPFHAEDEIQREVWKKAIINAAFNSICPLLEADNGIFRRDPAVADLANDLVVECLAVAERLGLGLTRAEVMQQILQISESSDGQLISTLQDLHSGRETEIEYLNLAIARIAAAQRPPVSVPRTELLGKLVLVRSMRGAPTLPRPGR